MKLNFLRAACLGLAILSAGNASAAIVGGVYNTGVDDSGVALADGSRDMHYSVVGSTAMPYVYPYPMNYGAVVSPNAKFISNQPNGYNNSQVSSVYSTTFNLTGYNPASASLTGSIAVDDYVSVLLNGNLIYQSTLNTVAYASLATFASSQYFISGMNTLTFSVANIGMYTGFQVANLRVNATLGVPGPIAGAGFPVLAGLFGVWFVRRSRASQSA